MKNKIILVLSILLGLMLVNSGLNKFFHYMELPEMPEGAMKTMKAFMESGWVFTLVALAEIVGGILVVIPKTRALGAIIILPVVIGIAAFHLVQTPGEIVIGILMLVVNIVIIADSIHRYRSMIS